MATNAQVFHATGRNSSPKIVPSKVPNSMHRSARPRRRRGIATVECALCLPLLIVLTLGTIEVCSAMFLKEAVTIAAYEGARVGIQRRGTNDNVERRIHDFLDERGIVYSENSIQISEPSFDDAQELQHVTTTVTVPCESNTFTGWVLAGRTISASVTLRKEFTNPEE